MQVVNNWGHWWCDGVVTWLSDVQQLLPEDTEHARQFRCLVWGMVIDTGSAADLLGADGTSLKVDNRTVAGNPGQRYWVHLNEGRAAAHPIPSPIPLISICVRVCHLSSALQNFLGPVELSRSGQRCAVCKPWAIAELRGWGRMWRGIGCSGSARVYGLLT